MIPETDDYIQSLECGVLNTLIERNSLIPTAIKEIQPKFFTVGKLGELYTAIALLFEEYGSVDVALMRKEVKELKSEIYAVMHSTSFPEQVFQSKIKEIKTNHKNSEFSRIIGKISADLPKGIKKLDDYILRLTSKLSELCSETSARSYDYTLDDMIQHGRDACDMPDLVVPFPFKNINEKLYGGIPCGDLVIIGAPPGSGKTSFCFQWLYEIAQSGYRGLFFSTEMNRRQLGLRTVSYFKGKNYFSDRRNKDAFDDVAVMVADFGQNIVINDNPAPTIQYIRNTFQQHNDRRQVDILFVDFLQQIKGRNANQSANERVGESAYALKEIAKEFNIPVVAISSMNRNYETRGGDKIPVKSDLRDSGNIEFSADDIFFLYEKPEAMSSEDKKKILFLIAKARNAKKTNHGDIELLFQGDIFKFRDNNFGG